LLFELDSFKIKVFQTFVNKKGLATLESSNLFAILDEFAF